MPDYPIIKNACIESASIQFEDGFVLTVRLVLHLFQYDQGFGGYNIGGSPFDEQSRATGHAEQANIAADFIGGIMAVAGVENWNHLEGRVIRVAKDNDLGDILAIGHPVEDRWYEPEKRFDLLNRQAAA